MFFKKKEEKPVLEKIELRNPPTFQQNSPPPMPTNYYSEQIPQNPPINPPIQTAYTPPQKHDSYFLPRLPELKSHGDEEDHLSKINKAVDIIGKRFEEQKREDYTQKAPMPPMNLKPHNSPKIFELEDEYLKIRPTKDEVEEQEIEVETRNHKKDHYVMVEDYKKVIEQVSTIKIKVKEFEDKTNSHEGFLERHKRTHDELLKKFEYIQRHLMLVDQTLYKGRGGM